MATRNEDSNKIDIGALIKEEIFQLLLQLEPNEIRIVCFSKNKRVREVCTSKYFRDTYKEKHLNWRELL